MASGRLKEMRDKLDSELKFDRLELEKELFGLRFKSSAEGLPNPSRINQLRRDIARIHTLLRERELNIRGAEARS
jgi:large subunit ribosomal protein L29